MDGFVQTRPAQQIPANGNYGMFAIDCEMVSAIAWTKSE